MTFRPLAVGLLAAVLCFAAQPTVAQVQQAPVLPSQAYPTVQSAATIPEVNMPPVNTEALRRNAETETGDVDPYRYGTVLDTDLLATRDGQWERLPSGDWLWRLRIRSDDAVSLSVAFTRFQLPEGAALYVRDPAAETVRGPYTPQDETANQLWTPIVRGGELIIELQVPQNRRRAVDLELGRVIHGFRPLRPSAQRGDLSKAGTCNVDVACEEADPWRKQVRSVGRYSYVKSDGIARACSGALVNNTARDRTPYFLTAEHCVSTPDVATSMVFYWNYENPTCRERGTDENGEVTDDPLSEQTSSGAVLRARYGDFHEDGNIVGKPDLALVEVDDVIPGSYNLYLSGWNRRGQATARGVTIHHPAGHGKRISFDDDSTTVTTYGETGGGNTHLRVGNWDLGTTEAGSSGGPLFDSNQHIVGVLSGGFAGCASSGSAVDNDRPDWYGRLALGFDKGDYQNTTIADVLDPLSTGADTLGGMKQTAGADLIPPAPILDFRISRINTAEREVTLRWTATGDDRRVGTANRYELRVDTARIETLSDFQQARQIMDVPDPAPAGQSERLVLGPSDGLEQGRTYYFALLAEDEAGNRSARAKTQNKAVLVKSIEIEEGGVRPGATQSVSRTRFVLNQTQDVRVGLYDVLGRRLRILLDERVREGFEKTVRFDTNSLSSGPYFLHFRGETFATTRKIVVVQ